MTSTDGFLNELNRRARQLNPDVAFKGKNTICKQVAKRGPHLKMFAKRFDVVIFAAGKQSSNGKILSETCKSVNKNTYVISSVEELEKTWFEGIISVGITGATSTPKWLLKKIAYQIQIMTS